MPGVFHVSLVQASALKASTGRKLAARLAGWNPNRTPTPPETSNANATEVHEIFRVPKSVKKVVAETTNATATKAPAIEPAELMKIASSKN